MMNQMKVVNTLSSQQSPTIQEQQQQQEEEEEEDRLFFQQCRADKHDVYTEFPPNCMNLVNVSAVFRLGIQPFEFSKLIEAYPFVQSELEVLIIHTEPPRTCARITGTGQVTIMGATNKWALWNVAHTYVKWIQAAGYPEARVLDFRLSFYTATIELPFTVDVHAFHRDQTQGSIPINFPSCVHFSTHVLPNDAVSETQQQQQNEPQRTVSHSLYAKHVVLKGAKHERDLVTSFQNRAPWYYRYRESTAKHSHKNAEEEEEEEEGIFKKRRLTLSDKKLVDELLLRMTTEEEEEEEE
jgi:hypothetical protein